MSTYIPKNFIIEELVPPSIIQSYGAEGSWQFLDTKLVWTIDKIREALGKKITINTWKWKGQFSERGYRDPKSKTGAVNSMHKKGKAVDFDVEGMTAEQVRNWIRKNYKTLDCLKYITGMEKGVSWVHIDVRPYDRKALGLFEFNP